MFRSRRLVPPPDPKPADLLAESEAREVMAFWRRRHIELAELGQPRDSDSWPDPYGPDETVFGPRRHKSPFSD